MITIVGPETWSLPVPVQPAFSDNFSSQGKNYRLKSQIYQELWLDGGLTPVIGWPQQLRMAVERSGR